MSTEGVLSQHQEPERLNSIDSKWRSAYTSETGLRECYLTPETGESKLDQQQLEERLHLKPPYLHGSVNSTMRTKGVLSHPRSWRG